MSLFMVKTFLMSTFLNHLHYVGVKYGFMICMSPNIKIVKSMRLQWAEHVARLEEVRNNT
jgi:hypothetical protein